ncbi:MAG: hypothetical protein KTR33_01630 [Gammaproteobacteria bacterium]|nr:hypothetical protein [Gammaproteobacteria bacterium]
MKFVSRLSRFLEIYHRHGVLTQLRTMSDRQLLDCGISPELMEQGVKAWPWRQVEKPAPRPLSLTRVQPGFKAGSTPAEMDADRQQDVAA